jgi:hypothetical protein
MDYGLALYSNYGKSWNKYLEAIYAWFKQDFIDNKPAFQGRRLGLKRHPPAKTGHSRTSRKGEKLAVI